MLRLTVVLVLAVTVLALLIRLAVQVVNHEERSVLWKTLRWLALPALFAAWIGHFPINPFPVRRFHDDMLSRLKPGMTEAEVDGILGAPAGHYGNPEFNAGEYTQEGFRTEPGNSVREWSDDRFLLSVEFDAGKRLVNWHRRARAHRYFEGPLSAFAIHRFFRRLGF